MRMFSPFKYLIPAIASAFTLASALEVSDLSMGLTRSEADDTLTKNYEYTVMNDLMVRRTWSDDSRRIIKVDFDPKDDSLKSIIVEYKEPVSVKLASKDILSITKAPKISWRKLSSNRADKYGINRARAAKVDGAYILLDTDDSDKCLYFILTPEKPDEAPRTSVPEMDLNDSGETALGSASSHSRSAGLAIMDDEEKRHMTPNKTDEETDIVADSDIDVSTSRVTVRSTPKKTKKAATPTVAQTTPAKDAKKETDISAPVRKSTMGEDIEDGVSDFVEEQGLDEIPPMYYAIGGGALVLLFIIIGAIRRKAAAKKIAAQAERLRRNPHLAGASIKSKRRR